METGLSQGTDQLTVFAAKKGGVFSAQFVFRAWFFYRTVVFPEENVSLQKGNGKLFINGLRLGVNSGFPEFVAWQLYGEDLFRRKWQKENSGEP